MLICCERKTLLNGWLILADKLERTGYIDREAEVQTQAKYMYDASITA
jgi:hypothetical protein